MNYLVNVSASAEYTKQLGTAQGAGLEFGKGLLAGNDALNATAASALQTAGQVYYLSDSQNMANMKAASFSQGMQEQALAMKNTQVETEKTRGTVEKMREQWVTGEAQSTAFNKAVQDQALAFEQSKVNVEALKGTLSELVTEWNSGEAATVAFNTAFQEQEIQATKNLAANEALKGTYSALVMEYDNGITTFNAVNKGFMEQEISIYKVVEAADELKGKILAMDQEWESGAAQLSSFIKGYYEQETAFRESAKAGEALKGTVAAMATEFNNQYTALQNSNIGMVEQQKVIMDAMTAYQKGSGTLEEYNTQLQSGLPQALAYQSAIDKTKMAMGQQQEATAALLGTTVELMDELGSAEGVITRYFKGFAEGYNEITKWAGGIEEAIGKDKAMQQAVMETADKLGVDLPEGFRGSVESAKEWIEISKGVPATLESIARTAAEAGKSLRSGLVDALSDDKGDLDKAFEGIEKKLGSGLSDTVKNALTKAAIGDKMVNEFQTAVDLISTVKADPAALSETVNTVMEKFESLVMDHPALESMRTELESALSALQVDPNNQAALDQVRNILGRVKDEALGLNKTIPPLNSTIKDQTTEMVDVNAAWKAYVDTLGNIDITKAVQDFKTLTAGVDAAQQAIRRYNDQNKVGLNEMYASGDTRAVYASTDPSTLGGESITVGEDIQKYNEGAGRYAAQGPLGGGANVDFTAQIAQIDAFKTKLAEVAPAVTAMVTASNAALATFMQPLATITGPALTLVEQMLLKLPTDVTTMVQTANGGLATFMQPLATITGPALVLIEQMLLKVPTDVTTMVTTSNANLATFMQPLATITGPALVLIEQMLLKVPTDVTTMVTTANTNLTPLFTPLTATIFPKMQTDAATSFQAVTNIATEESGRFPPLFETAATAIDTALKKTENTSATTFEAVVNIGKEEADKLGPIFDTAAKDIDTALKEVETTSAETFEAVTTSAEDSGESVTTAMEDASQAVQDALDEMEQKATDTFESISESAQEATESVEELADAIDSLEDKTVTITTRYVTEGSPGAATGFGPTVVEHPMNLTVGEAGPEYVSIIPLSSASKKNLPTAERLAIFGDPGKKRKNPLRTTMDLSNTSPYSNYQAKTVGRIPMALGTVNNYSNMTSNSDMSSVVISGSAITSFSNSISRFSSSVERQNSIMQQSAAVNSTNVYGNGGGGRSGFSLPDLSIGGNGRGGRSSGSAGMGGFDNLVTAIKEAVLAGFQRTHKPDQQHHTGQRKD